MGGWIPDTEVLSWAEGLGHEPHPLSPQNPEGITVISQNLLAQDGFLARSFKLPQIIRCSSGSPGRRVGGSPWSPSLLILCVSVLGPGASKPVTKVHPSRSSRQPLKSGIMVSRVGWAGQSGTCKELGLEVEKRYRGAPTVF